MTFSRDLAALTVLLLFTTAIAAAPPRIAVLDFELNDLTINPYGAEELARTASVAPLLRQALAEAKDCAIVEIAADAQQQADKSFGYLFDHANLAAELGHQFGADWVAVGRLHKPSYLFAYLKVHLVNVETGQLADDLIVEIKGASDQLTRRGTKRLAEKIHESLAQQ